MLLDDSIERIIISRFLPRTAGVVRGCRYACWRNSTNEQTRLGIHPRNTVIKNKLATIRFLHYCSNMLDILPPVSALWKAIPEVPRGRPKLIIAFRLGGVIPRVGINSKWRRTS